MKTSRLASPANPCGASRHRALTTAFPAGNPLIRPFGIARNLLASIIGFCAIALGAATFAAEYSAKVIWNPNPETDIDSYQVSYGSSSGSYSQMIDAGTSTFATVTGLQEGTTYYFVVTAVNQAGVESEPSTEVSFMKPASGPPVAAAASVTTAEDTPVAIALSATDPEGASLSYSIVSGPSKGTLSGIAPNLTYTPAADFNGSDSFTFKANDGSLNSNTATVSITVTAVNDAPVAVAKAVSTAADAPVAITLSATDSDRNALTYSIVSGPANGTLSGIAPNLTYIPSAGFSGLDSFTFKASDGSANSNTATVSITVTSSANNAPVALAKSVTTEEDTPVAISLSATDKDGNPLTYAIVSGPANGTLAGNGANLIYTPSADFNGSDSFTFKANDGSLDSNTATVSISISAVNDAPVVVAKSMSTAEDTPMIITLSATDKDSSVLSCTIVGGPTKGTLSGSSPLLYTPAADFNGTDSFTFMASDGYLNSSIATVTITVTAVNDAPVAVAKAVTTAEDTQVAIGLSATDKDGNALTYAIVGGPVKGTLAGIAPNLTYIPSADFNGSDSFTYKANDGSLNSNTATVSITVTAVNDAPVAAAKSVTTAEDTPVAIGLSATDKDGNALAYAIVGGPSKGTLSGTAPNLTYIPSADFNGSDSFTYKAHDGSLNSNTATVSITVTAVNDAPVAIAKSASTVQSTPVAIALSATDKDSITLTCSIIGGPANGTLSGDAPNLTYTPTAGFNGSDSFTYKANDGSLDSNTATVSITVTVTAVINDAPVAMEKSVTTAEDTPVSIALSATGKDANALTYSIISGPAKGTFSGIAPNLTYIPSADFNGSDSFTYKANDGSMDSNTATVSITVTAVNDAPVAMDKAVSTAADAPVAIALSATDPDGTTPTCVIVSKPAKGILSGTAPDLTYTPAAGFSGSDSFTYQAEDGGATSNTATVSITVTPKEVVTTNKPPVFKSNPITGAAGKEKKAYKGQSIAVSAYDPDPGDAITFRKISGPAWLTVSSNGKLSGTPPAGSAGSNQFGIRATDKAGATAESILVIEISSAALSQPWQVTQLGTSSQQMGTTATQQSETLTLEASGTLAGSSDSGTFVWQPLSGNGQIIAQVDSLEDGKKSTAAGVMIRDSMAPGSRHVFVGVNGGGDFRWVRRTHAGKQASVQTLGDGSIPKTWLRLVRKGDTIVAYKSANRSNWKRIGAITTNYGPQCYIGLIVCGGRANMSSADFSHVIVKP